MLNITQKEETALQLVLSFISVKELLKAAEDGFATKDTIRATDNSDLCYKAIESFLN